MVADDQMTIVIEIIDCICDDWQLRSDDGRAWTIGLGHHHSLALRAQPGDLLL